MGKDFRGRLFSPLYKVCVFKAHHSHPSNFPKLKSTIPNKTIEFRSIKISFATKEIDAGGEADVFSQTTCKFYSRHQNWCS